MTAETSACQLLSHRLDGRSDVNLEPDVPTHKSVCKTMAFDRSVTSCDADASCCVVTAEWGLNCLRRLLTGLRPYLISNFPEIILESEEETVCVTGGAPNASLTHHWRLQVSGGYRPSAFDIL